jgi:hypothetical protein
VGTTQETDDRYHAIIQHVNCTISALNQVSKNYWSVIYGDDSAPGSNSELRLPKVVFEEFRLQGVCPNTRTKPDASAIKLNLEVPVAAVKQEGSFKVDSRLPSF